MTEAVETVWGDRKPASTLIPVPASALESMLVEIDVTAVCPHDATPPPTETALIQKGS